jgi:hydroxymethylbilane synthase
VDAILLAAAGLDRLEKTEWVRERLDPALFCPAAGQGALGIETRKGERGPIGFLDDGATRFAVTVERAALAALGGGCQVPIGVHCRALPGGFAEVFAVVANPESGQAVRVYLEPHHVEVHAVEVGKRVANKLIDAGAGPLLESVSGVSR